jgi:exoribonuclease R
MPPLSARREVVTDALYFSSLHPFGTLVEEVGPIGQVEVETSALLKDCKCVGPQVERNVVAIEKLTSLRSQLPIRGLLRGGPQVPASDALGTSSRLISRALMSDANLLPLAVDPRARVRDAARHAPDARLHDRPCTSPSWPRREYRRLLPDANNVPLSQSTAKDLDDALSITATEDGNYEVGVHIADVSHFVKTNTALDRDARKKATSVYLVQRAVPMLPPTLSEELCSLVPDVERLAFSAFFTMTKDGRVLGSSFAKTIIKSCAKLAYEDAQAVIEGKSLGDRPISDGFKKDDIEEDIRLLNGMAVKMAERRIENGALRIDKLKLNFRLDDKGLPIDCSAYERKAANSLVEEVRLFDSRAGRRHALLTCLWNSRSSSCFSPT